MKQHQTSRWLQVFGKVYQLRLEKYVNNSWGQQYFRLCSRSIHSVFILYAKASSISTMAFSLPAESENEFCNYESYKPKIQLWHWNSNKKLAIMAILAWHHMLYYLKKKSSNKMSPQWELNLVPQLFKSDVLFSTVFLRTSSLKYPAKVSENANGVNVSDINLESCIFIRHW